MTDNWSNKYVGLPFEEHGRGNNGFDCWGLVRHVYKNERDIELDSFDSLYISTKERRAIASIFDDKTSNGEWVRVGSIIDYSPMDVLVFRTGPLMAHVGLFVTGTRMLHVKNGMTSKLDLFNSAIYADRLVGAYRYHG